MNQEKPAYKNSIHILELSKYEPPKVVENNKHEWVEWGSENDYFDFLIDRYTTSPTNNAVINNIVRLIYGKGLTALDASRKPNDYAVMIKLFSKETQKQVITDLKMLGNSAIQVIYNKQHTKIVQVEHIPTHLIRAGKCNKDGIIDTYFYSENWSDTKKFPPKPIAAFGTSSDAMEILYIKPYSVGMKYYSYPDYQGAIPYAVLENDIANYLINEVQNGFSGRKVINFNNGIPTPEERDMVAQDVYNKVSGPEGLPFIISFNDDETRRTTVEDISMDDAPSHYEYLAEECMRKIMLGHNVTSPLIFGIATTTGFSSNAEELENSFVLYDNMVIRPFQEMILDAFDKILAFNGITLDLAFKTLKPLEFSGTETKTTLSKQDYVHNQLADGIIELGEVVDENWILIDEYPVDYETDEKDNEMLSKELKPSFLSKIYKLISTGDNRPNIRSSQDEVIDGIKFITRYVYAGNQTPEREFCRKMMQAEKIYRKEDIVRMSNQVVNEGWGPRGTDTYDIWKYKGGGNCHHFWMKRVYATFSGKAINVEDKKNLKVIAGRKAEKLGYVVKNPDFVAKRPVDMDNYGFLPSNPQPKRAITK